jgi:hypothetical protein
MCDGLGSIVKLVRDFGSIVKLARDLEALCNLCGARKHNETCEGLGSTVQIVGTRKHGVTCEGLGSVEVMFFGFVFLCYWSN